MPDKCKRKRPYRVYIYVTKGELEHIRQQAKTAGLSIGEYCRRVLREEIVTPAATADQKELVWEVRRIGSNLNQLVRQLHAYRFDPGPDLLICIKDIESIKELIISNYS
ncbi:MAG: hypothetical protein K6F79_08610 [Saccharofermentans sp.]|nr:hypothetical protein [Saccharofermentans sp.]